MPDLYSIWTDVLWRYFKPFMEFFLPEISNVVDWKKEPSFLEKEFFRIDSLDAEDLICVDALVKVYTKSDKNSFELIHLEFVFRKRKELPLRMFKAHYRIHEKYNGKSPVGFVIFADPIKGWHPTRLEMKEEFAGCSLTYDCGFVKILDYAKYEEVFLSEKKIIQLFTLMAIGDLRTRNNLRKRRSEKKRLKSIIEKSKIKDQDLYYLLMYLDAFFQPLPETTNGFLI